MIPLDRYDEDAPSGTDYLCQCAWCGQDFPRSELAWRRDELECAPCEASRHEHPDLQR